VSAPILPDIIGDDRITSSWRPRLPIRLLPSA